MRTLLRPCIAPVDRKGRRICARLTTHPRQMCNPHRKAEDVERVGRLFPILAKTDTTSVGLLGKARKSLKRLADKLLPRAKAQEPRRA